MLFLKNLLFFDNTVTYIIFIAEISIDRPRDAETYYQNLQKMAEERFKKRMEERQRIIQQEQKVCYLDLIQMFKIV